MATPLASIVSQTDSSLPATSTRVSVNKTPLESLSTEEQQRVKEWKAKFDQ